MFHHLFLIMFLGILSRLIVANFVYNHKMYRADQKVTISSLYGLNWTETSIYCIELHFGPRSYLLFRGPKFPFSASTSTAGVIPPLRGVLPPLSDF